MAAYLTSGEVPETFLIPKKELDAKLTAILREDGSSDFYAMFSRYHRILSDNSRRSEWPIYHDKLCTLFTCGRFAALDGPMIGVSLSIRDSDFFKSVALSFKHDRSLQAGLEVLATAWNATFSQTGIWMGKTFEPVQRATVADLCDNDEQVMSAYNATSTRIGRNFFRAPEDPNFLQSLGLPALTRAWHLVDRPTVSSASGFLGQLVTSNLDKEKVISYTKTGGHFIAQPGRSVVPEMQQKAVYQLNYRWPKLRASFPMSCLVDEVVQVDDGIYLGQLVFATKHFSLGTLDLPFLPESIAAQQLGEAYVPNQRSPRESREGSGQGDRVGSPDYGYQNNGFFLLMDPIYADRIYADSAFPQIRPH